LLLSSATQQCHSAVPLSTATQQCHSAVCASSCCHTVTYCLPQEPDPETLTPGPGAYHSRPSTAPVGFSTAAAGRSGASYLPSSRTRTQQPLFARAAGRSAALSMGPGWSLPPSKHTAPGPGTYNLRSAATGGQASADRAIHSVAGGSMRQGAGVRVASILAAGPAAAGEQGGAELAAGAAAAAALAAGFGCTSRRFGDNSTASPGPGGSWGRLSD
jgi:hypothetical protein